MLTCLSMKTAHTKALKPSGLTAAIRLLNVGDIPYGPVSVAFDETTAKKFRLVFSNFNLTNFLSTTGAAGLNVGIAEISLSSAPRLESYIEKQLGKMCQTPFPLWKEYQWKYTTRNRECGYENRSQKSD